MQQTEVAEPKWLTVRQAAAYLGVKYRTILAWIGQRKIRAYRLSGTERITWRFLKSDLDAMMTPVNLSSPSTAETGELIAR